MRDDVLATAKAFFPTATTASAELVDAYRAALGTKPGASAPTSVHLAYLDYLGAFEKFDELESYVNSSLPTATRQPAALKAVELYAQAGRAAGRRPPPRPIPKSRRRPRPNRRSRRIPRPDALH